MKQDSTFDMQEEDYALSKDIDVTLWIVYRTFYGECPLKELLGGNFVIVNEHLQEEFEKFRGKIQCAIGTTHILVKGIELLKLKKSINAYLKSVAVLGSTYFLMNSSDLDDICQWVTDKRSYFCGKQFTVDGLLERTEQCASLLSDSRRASYKHDKLYSSLQYLAKGDMCCTRIDTYPWKSFTCAAAYNDQCSHRPAATTRIAADGNCFFNHLL